MDVSVISIFDSDKSLSYSFFSSKPKKNQNDAKYALSIEDEYWFDSDFSVASAPYFWQISFSKFVVVNRYCICTNTPGRSEYIKSWKISYSIDNKTFIPLQIDKFESLTTDAVSFNLSRNIKCKHFKITTNITSIGSTTWLAIRKFDLFGYGFIFERNCNTFDIRYIRHRLLGEIFILMMPSLMT